MDAISKWEQGREARLTARNVPTVPDDFTARIMRGVRLEQAKAEGLRGEKTDWHDYFLRVVFRPMLAASVGLAAILALVCWHASTGGSVQLTAEAYFGQSYTALWSCL